MRGKWVLGAAAILALVVVGAVGGVTVRAFAGTSHVTVTDTKVVTKFCVYVDRRNGGDSYGDLSVVPKYSHKVCIVGKRGPSGSSSIVSWNKTIATAGAPPGAKHFARKGNANFVDLAKIGPFTIRGFCSSVEGVQATTDVVSGQDGSSFAWDDNVQAGSFNSGNTAQASNSAYGSSESAGYATEYDNGDFAVTTADGATAFTGFATNGVYINGAEGPACSFQGHVVIENAAPSS
jgi:hypothetical protein